MKRILRLAVVIVMLGLIRQSGAVQAPGASAQPSHAQASQDADKAQAQTPEANWYVDASGRAHFRLTPEGDVVTPPGSGPHSPANGKIAGGVNLGIPATPANPALVCPPRPMPTPLTGAAGKARNHLVGYIFFFNNMEALDAVADQDEKRGDLAGAAAWRTHDQRALGLNDAEGQIMKEIRVDYTEARKKFEKKSLQVIRNFRLATKGDMCAPSPPEFAELDRENLEIIQAHVTQLRVALGPVSFQKLDDFVSHVFEPKPPVAETKGVAR
jgi:hypothetical protein